jgi:hypothetical protein
LDANSEYQRIGRNDQCPCGSGQKYKRCCSEKVDWNGILQHNLDWRPHISMRGRNIEFLNRICEALQLDKRETPPDLAQFKAAFTAAAVREIHEAIVELWPRHIDILETLGRAAKDVSGLYIGDYDQDYILRGIVRHSIYANKILIVDPFVYPYAVHDEFNPILEPEQFRTQTLKNVNLWFALEPWIDAGIVEIIRTPADFDPVLNWQSLERQEQKFKDHPELQSARDATVDELGRRHTERFASQDFFLSAPDEYLERVFKEVGPQDSEYGFDTFIASIRRQRELNPNFLEPLDTESRRGQLHILSSGASYDMARITASIMKSYLVTDLQVKWREIELDRKSHSAENKAWAPFAKALQDAQLKYLNNVHLRHALQLRKEGRLEGLRTFLHGVWKAARTEEPFDDANSILLAQQLTERIRQAEIEWKQIDTDLLKTIGMEVKVAALAAGPLIANGHGFFLAAAAVAAAGGALVDSIIKHRRFPDRFPAAFFMHLGH